MHIAPDLEEKASGLLEKSKNTLFHSLGMEFISIELNKVVVKMPVDQRTHQPFGLLHGGASVALAETIASSGAWFNVDETKYSVVGLEINANHVRPMRAGEVTGTGVPIHKGRSTQIWEIKITNDKGKLVSISRCTLAVVKLHR